MTYAGRWWLSERVEMGKGTVSASNRILASGSRVSRFRVSNRVRARF